MENRTIIIVIALVLAYMLFLRKPTLSRAGVGGSVSPIITPKSPSPAIPNPSTGQIVAAAAIQNAPQILSALGSFLSDDSGGGGSDDSYSYSDDDFSYDDA